MLSGQVVCLVGSLDIDARAKHLSPAMTAQDIGRSANVSKTHHTTNGPLPASC